jgi:hypothetical protein
MVDSPKPDDERPDSEDCDDHNEVPDAAADPDFDTPTRPTLSEFAQRSAAEYLHKRKRTTVDSDE